jgi:hypothetical protein
MKAFIAKVFAIMSLQVLFSTKALRFYGCFLLLVGVVLSNVAIALLGGFLIYYARNEEQPIA